METLLDRYMCVCTVLKKYEDKLSRAQLALSDGQQMYVKSIHEADEALKDSICQNEASVARVSAFIEIAKMHTTKLFKHNLPIPFDNGKLSRLAVQINSGNTDDLYATQLYTEAAGQLQYLLSEQACMKHEHEKKIESWKSFFEEKKKAAQILINKAETNIREFLYSKEFTNFISLIERDKKFFNNNQNSTQLPYEFYDTVSIGLIRLPLSIPLNLYSDAVNVTKGLFDTQTCTIEVPVNFGGAEGSVIIAEYENASEEILLSGIQNYILNIFKYYNKDYSQVCFMDPIRYNASSLGCLAKLCTGDGAFVDAIPKSVDELRNKVKSIVTELNMREADNNNYEIQRKKKALYVFHNFPQSYDSTVVAQIQQLCVNAQHYGITVILTSNQSSNNFSSKDTLDFLRTKAIIVTTKSIYGMDHNINAPFTWYSAPNKLPDDIARKFISERPVINLNNDYLERIGLSGMPQYQKGVRSLKNIPFGIGTDGILKTLDFENSNFATFICGASRSGKTTLLHTLITGFIQNNHPDDVEIWLIDFKMTEFSRYITHLPPHIRYIILDESPELVYDIIDRLTEIMLKRQNIFKGKWQKLNDIPESKYMPAILVIIDEFSVMSQVIADSAMISKENYAVKLQMLLAKGAALGMHFIFSSQGFTSGTRGLNDFAKKQVQQRIAMTTEYSEIKDTMDLKTASDEDKALMEQLPVHHAVTRIPVDARGNHLSLSHVIYISDYSKQERMIDTINKNMKPVMRYDVHNISAYISKKPMIKDGNIYEAFSAKTEEIQAYINSHNDIFVDESEFVIFVGEPRRMLSIYPIHVVNEFCENLLLVASLSEKIAATSVLLSISDSLNLQGQNIELWSTKKNPIYRHIKFDCGRRYAEKSDLEAICREIRSLKNAILNKIEANKFFVLIGFESILIDMSFQTGATPSEFSSYVGGYYEKRDAGKPDLKSLMASMHDRVTSANMSIKENTTHVLQNSKDLSGAYDAREDLKYILTNGPRLGYHFIMHFSSPGDINQSKMDISLFKHKIMFRTSKNEATFVMGAANAAIVADLDPHSFRYSNGMDSLSFRPYLHQGLSWDGWQISDGEVVQCIDEEEEYLL